MNRGNPLPRKVKFYLGFLKIYGVVSVILGIPFLFNLLFVIHARENLSFSEIAELQWKEDALYGTAMNQSIFPYKLELVKYRRPDILGLGSSTIMTMREEFFNASFVNCSNGMNNITEGELFLREVLKYYRPKLIIMAVDFWWFGNQPEPKDYDYHQNAGSQITFEKLTRPFGYLFQGKVTPGEYFSLVLSRKKENNISSYSPIGLRAIKRSDGYRRDGSAFVGSRIFGLDPNPVPIGFNPAANVRRRYDHGKEMSEEKIRRFEEIIQIMKENSIPFLVILPPISEESYNIIHSIADKHRYIEEVRRYFRSRPYEVYDFHNMSEIGSNNCECLDGFHMGEIAYQRVLLAILKRNPHSVLRPYLKVGLLQENLRRFPGRVLTVFDTDEGRFNYKEADFLGIGCKKQPLQ
jgi:hypothetical protein